MKLICPYSGVSYKTSIGYGHGKVRHPIFSLPLPALVGQSLSAYLDNKLQPTEIHLLGCALLNHLPIIWEKPLQETICLPYWKARLEQLATIVSRLDHKLYERMPKYHISEYNCDLTNLHEYLTAVDASILEYNTEGYKATPSYMRNRTEETILRLLRSSIDKAQKKGMLPNLMADWAADAGRFPNTKITIGENKYSTLRDHWHYIIMRAFTVAHPVEVLSESITLGDLDELLEHCEENIDVGSIHSLALFRKLRVMQEVLEEFRPAKKLNVVFQDPNLDISAMLTEGSEAVQVINKVYKEGEPRRTDYPTLTAFFKAKKQWADRLAIVESTEDTLNTTEDTE